ncbi:MAG TPA: substrate-binding domain-containing protein [Dysgonomonas sp.]|uniref:substrate-binding domain-containing protein n=1 Tax=unclassified Dysgonomonas TaxID=2630389 RepID=UPI0025C57B9E|nr:MULTISPECIES: substrate-binding domain-containing protein [unclassified Dysgonomonas]HML66013.1 substrate-binding domain-containing protein [Dysgonomonas sp.]
MKKTVVLLLLTLLSLAILFSCQKSKKAKFVIGVSQCSDDLWRTRMNQELIRETSFHPHIEIEIKTVKDNTEEQIKDIESFINQGVDLLVISPNEAKAITPIIKKAYLSGIPIILVDRKIETNDYTAYVGADNFQIGKELGMYVVDVLKGEGSVVEMRGLEGSTSDAERHAGFMDAIKDYPQIRILAEGRGNFLKADAKTDMKRILQQHDSIDLVFAMNDQMALGVREATLEHNCKAPFIIGIDALAGEGGGIQNIRDGLEDASFIYPTGGDKVIELAVKILNKEEVPRENTLYTAVVDKSNARVIQLQTDQIFLHQEKLQSMNELLNYSIVQYSNQRTLFYGTILIVVLLFILLVVSILAYRNKNMLNQRLEKQKEQLVSLSKELEEATDGKLIFFTNISHELKTPLTLILGPVESLLATENLNNEQKKLLTLMKLNSRRLFNLISQIIEFRSYENGKMEAHFVRADMRLFLDDLSTAFESYIKQKDVNFLFVCESDSFDMSFDKEKVEKIYFNLLSNAFKYLKKGGLLEVRLSRIFKNGKEYASIQVFNEGKLIPKDKINSIFKRFYKVNYHDAGTGIGLAFTSALVDIHHGEISVESENKGTTFEVLLPIEQVYTEDSVDYLSQKEYIQDQYALEVQDSNRFALTEDIPDENKPVILLIEDNAEVRDYFRLMLAKEYTLIEAEDGNDGINKTIKYIPDVVISDVLMPNMNGFEVCQILKKNSLTCHIPIILLTACALEEQMVEGFESGADAYISKPFNAEILKIRIRKLIENRIKIKDTFSMSLVNENKKSTIAQNEQDFINKFQENVIENISDSDLSVDNIARNMGLSRVQLYRKIKSVTEHSPNELIRIVRLKYALKLLSSGLSVAEVAYSSGFSSSSYFTKCFKEFYKETPSDYIKLKTDER